ncbi:MAG: hypothetical protein AAGU75_23550, partial [Bacillota bacterium]
ISLMSLIVGILLLFKSKGMIKLVSWKLQIVYKRIVPKEKRSKAQHDKFIMIVGLFNLAIFIWSFLSALKYLRSM